MDSNDLPRLIYLVLLGAVIGGYFIAANRQNLGQTARQALLWGLIFVGAIAAAGLWQDVRDDVMPRQSFIEGTGTIEVPRAVDGHYYLRLGINGVPVDFVVDTGASDMVLSARDARRVGIALDRLAYLGQARTANGVVPIAQVRLDSVTLGGMADRNVLASVNGGEMDGSLLGMSYLQRFGRIEIANNRLLLER
ncbi:retropepsin-like aspartic protease family protein [Oceaniglobus roseus]|uniref:retropepsin-like aspartic protease family protein n=1 Tax=Oceaniglobus roseus TaxID=1737570 RepID=UPI000C7F15CE|nr:TIGR02281 family clan AA aspartic protease [Kandeliimicrobium roseum]